LCKDVKEALKWGSKEIEPVGKDRFINKMEFFKD
jgi:hypothetical protein